MIDQIGDDSITDEKWGIKLMLEEGFKRLGKREKRIIHDRYFMGKTQMEIAAEIGISQAQVSRLEKNASTNYGRNDEKLIYERISVCWR